MRQIMFVLIFFFNISQAGADDVVMNSAGYLVDPPALPLEQLSAPQSASKAVLLSDYGYKQSTNTKELRQIYSVKDIDFRNDEVYVKPRGQEVHNRAVIVKRDRLGRITEIISVDKTPDYPPMTTFIAYKDKAYSQCGYDCPPGRMCAAYCRTVDLPLCKRPVDYPYQPTDIAQAQPVHNRAMSRQLRHVAFAGRRQLVNKIGRNRPVGPCRVLEAAVLKAGPQRAPDQPFVDGTQSKQQSVEPMPIAVPIGSSGQNK